MLIKFKEKLNQGKYYIKKNLKKQKFLNYNIFNILKPKE